MFTIDGRGNSDDPLHKSNPGQATLTFEQLLEAAVEGEWEQVESGLSSEHLTPERLEWAVRQGLLSPDENVREFCSMLFDESKEPLTERQRQSLTVHMGNDPHYVVCYRLAIALFKDGDTSPSVVRVMRAARRDPVVGQLAEDLWKAKHADLPGETLFHVVRRRWFEM